MFDMYDADLVGTRLNRTVIQIDGTYEYIMEVTGNREKGYSALTTHGKKRIDEKNISYSNMCIGTVFMNDAIFWSYRLPVRRWKAGLNPNNYAIQPFNSARWMYVKKTVFEANIEYIFDMLKGNYMNFQDSMHVGYGILSQHFAIKDHFLFYKAKPVGNVENNKFQFYNQFAYLKERFTQETKCIPG